MSYDLDMWSAKPVKRSDFPEPTSWKHFKNESQIQANGWVVCVSKSTKVDTIDKEELPSDYKKRFPKARYKTGIWVEPLGADKEGYKKLDHVANILAKNTDGIVVDLSSNEIIYPKNSTISSLLNLLKLLTNIKLFK